MELKNKILKTVSEATSDLLHPRIIVSGHSNDTISIKSGAFTVTMNPTEATRVALELHRYAALAKNK